MFRKVHDLYIEEERKAGTGRLALAKERERVVAERVAKPDDFKASV
jgi:hypothetical protein